MRRVKVALKAVMIMKSNGMVGMVLSRDSFRDPSIMCNIAGLYNSFSPSFSYSAYLVSLLISLFLFDSVISGNGSVGVLKI